MIPLRRTISRHAVNLSLPFQADKGVGDFLSPKTVSILLQLQQQYLERVNHLGKKRLIVIVILKIPW